MIWQLCEECANLVPAVVSPLGRLCPECLRKKDATRRFKDQKLIREAENERERERGGGQRQFTDRVRGARGRR